MQTIIVPFKRPTFSFSVRKWLRVSSPMKTRLIFLFLLVNVSLVNAGTQDSIRINGHLKGNTRFDKVMLTKFGVEVLSITSAPFKGEQFVITVPRTIEPGVYRLLYSQATPNDYVDVIIDGLENEISFTLDVRNDKRVPTFTRSVENSIWHSYKQEATSRLMKIALLQQFLGAYPDTTETVYRTVTTVANRQIQDFRTQLELFTALHRTSWAGILVANSPYYFTQPRDLLKIQNYYRKKNFWVGMNTNNPALINTPLYADMIISYLRYCMNPETNSSETALNEGLQSGVDTVMTKFGGNELTKKFALKYLQQGFTGIANEKVLQYINQKHQPVVEQCHDNGVTKEEFERRLAGYQAMKPGTPAPDIPLVGTDGKPYGLTTIPNSKLIVAFWASWCTHCEHEMPRLEAFVKEHPQFAAVAVSLDEDSMTYQKTRKLYPSMIHTCDYRQWQSRAAREYFVVATPSFFLLDAERNIVGKYPSFDALMEDVNKK